MKATPQPAPDLIHEPDGIARCWWCATSPEYRAYHDDEWGMPVADDHRLFEKLCLEGFQSGLSWLTILRKRDQRARSTTIYSL
jgi:DNA-3-methyladenine glycosylase I